MSATLRERVYKSFTVVVAPLHHGLRHLLLALLIVDELHDGRLRGKDVVRDACPVEVLGASLRLSSPAPCRRCLRRSLLQALLLLLEPEEPLIVAVVLLAVHVLNVLGDDALTSVLLPADPIEGLALLAIVREGCGDDQCYAGLGRPEIDAA